MDDKKTNMTFENAEKVFKRKAFDIFSEKIQIANKKIK